MKNYEQMTTDVLKRRDEYLMKKQKRKKMILTYYMPVAATFCFAVLIGLGVWRDTKQQSRLPSVKIETETSIETGTETISSDNIETESAFHTETEVTDMPNHSEKTENTCLSGETSQSIPDAENSMFTETEISASAQQEIATQVVANHSATSTNFSETTTIAVVTNATTTATKPIITTSTTKSVTTIVSTTTNTSEPLESTVTTSATSEDIDGEGENDGVNCEQPTMSPTQTEPSADINSGDANNSLNISPDLIYPICISYENASYYATEQEISESLIETFLGCVEMRDSSGNTCTANAYLIKDVLDTYLIAIAFDDYADEYYAYYNPAYYIEASEALQSFTSETLQLLYDFYDSFLLDIENLLCS